MAKVLRMRVMLLQHCRGPVVHKKQRFTTSNNNKILQNQLLHEHPALKINSFLYLSRYNTLHNWNVIGVKNVFPPLLIISN
jgi:hypothetical protein